MKRNNNLTLILVMLSALFLGLLVTVAHNDKGTATEVGLLNGAPASDAECDAMYHAIWAVEESPSRTSLIHTAYDMGCPFEVDGEYLYTWTPAEN